MSEVAASAVLSKVKVTERPLLYFIPAVPDGENSADVLPLVSMPQYSDPAALVRSFAILPFPFDPPDPFEVPSSILDVDGASQHDFGDAPNGAPSDYVNGALTGRFPNSPANGGPEHEMGSPFWLGDNVTGEAVPVLGADAADDGVLGLEVAACEASTLYLMVNLGGLPETERSAPLFVNLFADWNRDGFWEGADSCADEWTLQNYPLDLSAWDPTTPLILEAPQFIAGEQIDEFWYRVTLTATEIQDPATTFPSGETEDYLYTSDAQLTATIGGNLAAPFLAPRPSEPTFSCPGGIIAHGEWEASFFITQTASSQSLRVTKVRSADVLEVRPPRPGMSAPSIGQNSVEAGLLDDGRMGIALLLSLVHAEDESARIEGPYSVLLNIEGTFEGGTFDQQLACPYYVEHAELLGDSWIDGEHGTNLGAPAGVSGGNDATIQNDRRIIKPEGETFTLQSPNPAGTYDPTTLRLFSLNLNGAEELDPVSGGGGSNRVIEFENLDVGIPSKGRAMVITTERSVPPRVEELIFSISGLNNAGAPINDFFHVIIGDCAFRPPAGGLFKPTLVNGGCESTVDTANNGFTSNCGATSSGYWFFGSPGCKYTEFEMGLSENGSGPRIFTEPCTCPEHHHTGILFPGAPYTGDENQELAQHERVLGEFNPGASADNNETTSNAVANETNNQTTDNAVTGDANNQTESNPVAGTDSNLLEETTTGIESSDTDLASSDTTIGVIPDSEPSVAPGATVNQILVLAALFLTGGVGAALAVTDLRAQQKRNLVDSTQGEKTGVTSNGSSDAGTSGTKTADTGTSGTEVNPDDQGDHENEMASFSLRGSEQNLGISKPDITAPGVQILSDLSSESEDPTESDTDDNQGDDSTKGETEAGVGSDGASESETEKENGVEKGTESTEGENASGDVRSVGLPDKKAKRTQSGEQPGLFQAQVDNKPGQIVPPPPPDDTIVTVEKDKTVITEYLGSGTVVTVKPGGTVEVQYEDIKVTGKPDGTVVVEVHESSTTITYKPDPNRSTTIRQSDRTKYTETGGPQATVEKDGTFTLDYGDDEKFTRKPNGDTIKEESGGTKTTTQLGGTIITEKLDKTKITKTERFTLTERKDDVKIKKFPNGAETIEVPNKPFKTVISIRPHGSRVTVELPDPKYKVTVYPGKKAVTTEPHPKGGDKSTDVEPGGSTKLPDGTTVNVAAADNTVTIVLLDGWTIIVHPGGEIDVEQATKNKKPPANKDLDSTPKCNGLLEEYLKR